jgi:hypothetical protein
MNMRIDPRLSDLAGSGLVLLAFLLVAMALSAAPIMVHSLTRTTAHPGVISAPASHVSLG